MSVRQDRGRWTVEFQQGGVRVFKRLPAGITKAQAQEWETRERRAIFDRDELGHKEDLTLAGAIGLWLQNTHRKNHKQAVSEAKQWEPWVGGKLLKDAPEVAEEAVREWTKPRLISTTVAATAKARADALRIIDAGDSTRSSAPARTTTPRRTASPPCKPSTINRRLCILKAAAKWAWKQNLIPDNVSGRITLLKERNAREVYLTKSQVVSLAKAAPSEECRAAIWIAAYTGLRATECLSLTRIPSRSDTLTVASLKSKTGKPRVVPIAEPARPYLRALPLGLSYWQLHKQFITAAKKAGMLHVHFHDLRHTAASWLINEGVDLYTVGAILGHTSTQTTARYAHLATGTLKRAMAKLR
jgi:integrase